MLLSICILCALTRSLYNVLGCGRGIDDGFTKAKSDVSRANIYDAEKVSIYHDHQNWCHSARYRKRTTLSSCRVAPITPLSSFPRHLMTRT